MQSKLTHFPKTQNLHYSPCCQTLITLEQAA